MKTYAKTSNKKKSNLPLIDRYPNLPKYTLGVLLIGALLTVGVKSCDKEDTKKEQQAPVKKRQFKTYGEFYEFMCSLKPVIILDNMLKEGTVQNEQGLMIPYKDSNGNPTQGYGSTFIDGKQVTMKSAPITKEKALQAVEEHLQNETFFYMWCYIEGYGIYVSGWSEAQFIGLASVFYNSGNKLIENPESANNKTRFEILRQDFKKNGMNLSASVAKQRFQEYPVTDTRSFGDAFLANASPEELANKIMGFCGDGGGIYWRRWLEGQVIKGNIEPKKFLDLPMMSVYEFYKNGHNKPEDWYTVDANRNRCINDKTLKDFKAWMENPVDKNGHSMANWPLGRLRDYLRADIVKQIENGECVLDLQSGNTYELTEFDKKQAQAEQQYKDGKLKKSRKNYEDAAKLAPDNMSAQNDAAWLCDTTGKYDDAIKYSQIVLDNANSTVKEKAAAYYNMGYAYEKKAADHWRDKGKKADLNQAYECYQKASELLPNNPTYKKCMERVKPKSNVLAFSNGQKKHMQNVKAREKAAHNKMVLDQIKQMA